MDSVSTLHDTASQSFTKFPHLPIEIRRMVWSFATLRRPRTIQVFYNPEKKSWQACTDGCGGLPSIIPVSPEARTEGLKGYTWFLDTWVDFENDTVFISDPLFSLRKPRRVFMSSEYTSKIKSIAFTSDIFTGLADSNRKYQKLCEPPARILRNLKALEHFTMALSEDGIGFSNGSIDSDIDDEDEFEEIMDHETENDHQHINGNEQASEDVLAAQANRQVGFQNAELSATAIEMNRDGNQDTWSEAVLDHLEDHRMCCLSEGYFRHTGNIRLESAMENPDHWESWVLWRDDVVNHFEEEKGDYPEWIQPKVSIMAVKYGLKAIGDYSREVHFLGDHDDAVVVGEDINSDSNWDSELYSVVLDPGGYE